MVLVVFIFAFVLTSFSFLGPKQLICIKESFLYLVVKYNFTMLNLFYLMSKWMMWCKLVNYKFLTKCFCSFLGYKLQHTNTYKELMGQGVGVEIWWLWNFLCNGAFKKGGRHFNPWYQQFLVCLLKSPLESHSWR